MINFSEIKLDKKIVEEKSILILQELNSTLVNSKTAFNDQLIG
jgi:hypothetical protein